MGRGGSLRDTPVDAGVAFLRVADAPRRTTVLRTIDAWTRAGGACVLLVEESDDSWTICGEAASHGAVCARSDEPASVLAGLAAGSFARTRQVAELERDLRHAHAASESLRTQLHEMHLDMERAATLQSELIHRVRGGAPGVNVGVVSRPAGYVGGDLHDVDVLEDGSVSFFLADASGHGVSAAMMTLFLSRSLPRYCPATGDPMRPGAALTALNRSLIERGGTGSRFATAVYGLLDPATMTATIAGAGHPHPILTRASGAVERVEGDGPLLGVFEDGDFAEVTVELSPGDSLVLFSDGFEMVMPEPGADNYQLTLPTARHEDRLAALGRACVRSSEMYRSIAELERELDEQRGSLRRLDDVTAVVIAADLDAFESRSAA